MSLLDTNINAKKQAADQLLNTAKSCYNQLNTIAKSSFNQLWNNRLATPAEIAAELGANAAELFTLHEKLAAFLNDVKPGTWTTPAPKSYTKNNDGTVTIN